MLKYLRFIGKYIAEPRDEPMWKYVTEAWSRAFADDPDEE